MQTFLGIAVLIIGLLGMIIGVRLVLGYRAAPKWLRWSVGLIGGTSLFGFLAAFTRPTGIDLDVAVPLGVRLVTLGCIIFIGDGIFRGARVMERRNTRILRRRKQIDAARLSAYTILTEAERIEVQEAIAEQAAIMGLDPERYRARFSETDPSRFA